MTQSTAGKNKADATKDEETVAPDAKNVTAKKARKEEITLEQQLEQALAKAEESYDLALRTKAESENLLRRSERDIANARKYAIEGFVNDLIPVLDSLEQGMSIEQQSASSSMREGMELTFKLMVDVLDKHGVERLDPEGHPFNPEHHEAMTTVESEEVNPDHVMQVFQKGYLLNGRVVRPARVVVARGPTKPVDESA